MDVFEAALRALYVFISVVVGLLFAKYLLSRVEKLATPISKRVGVPASLVALTIAEARTPHVVLAEAYKSGAVEFRHILQFSFATWPIRVVLLHLRIGVIPIAIGALGLLGVVYLFFVYLSSFVGLAIAARIKKKWPDFSAAASRVATVNVWRTAASLTARYLIFEAIFLAIEAAGVKISLGWLPLSPEAVAVASISAFRPTYGIMAAAPAYWGGRIDGLETLVALLTGRLVYMTIYEFPRSAVQFYGSVYPAAVAGRLVTYTAAVMYSTTLPIILVLMAARLIIN